MKKIIFLITFYSLLSLSGYSQVETKGKTRTQLKEMVSSLAEENDSLKNKVDSFLNIVVREYPDSIPIRNQTGTDTLGWIYVHDGAAVVQEFSNIVKENRGDPIKMALAIAGLLFSIVTGGKTTQVLVSARKFYEGIKPVFGSKIGVVGFIATMIASVFTVLLTRLMDGEWGFNMLIFGLISGWAAYAAVFIYDRIVKPKEEAAKS